MGCLAGADIKEMTDLQFHQNVRRGFLSHWTHISNIKKPIVAAVNGYAVGSVYLINCYHEFIDSFISSVVDVNWQ